MPQDTLHDYCPDPEFEIKSHLDDSVAKSYEDFAIPDSVLKAAGFLADFHQQFYEDLKVNDSFYEPSVYKEAAAAAEEEEKPPQWSELDIAGKRVVVSPLTWDQLIKEAQAFFKSKNKPAGKPEELKAKDWHKDYAGFFPYIEAMLMILPDFSKIRSYFVDNSVAVIENVPKKLEDPEIGRKIIWGFVAFRTAYINLMLKKLKEGHTAQIGRIQQAFEGLNITHKANDGVEVRAGYDLVLGGSDDAAAAFEMCQAVRNAWRTEMSVLFDANVYCREWMVVKDEALPPSSGEGEDSSLQIQALDFIADVYSLVSVRRRVSDIEWAAFADAVKRGVDVVGLANPHHKGPDIVDMAAKDPGRSEIPLFRRLELADEVYKKQYLRPLWERLQDAFFEFKEAGMVRKLEYQGITMEKDAAGLERLLLYDKEKVLKSMSLAYFELAGKQRDLEKAIKYNYDYQGSFTWRQNNKDGALVTVDAPFNAEGMMTLIEKSSLLSSELALFRNDAHSSQGSVWTIAGEVEGDAPLANVDLCHRLQSFNEQIAEAVKETRAILLDLKVAKIMTDQPAPENTGQSAEDDNAEYKAAMEKKLNKAKTEREEAQKELEALKLELYDVKMKLGGYLSKAEIQREMDSIRTQGYSNGANADPGDKRRYQRIRELRAMPDKKKNLVRKREFLEKRLEPLAKKFEDAKKKEYEARQKYDEASEEKPVQADDNASSGDDFQKILLSLDELIVGFYRPARYDSRLEIQLQEMLSILAKDKAVTSRIEIYGLLFPDSAPPDQAGFDVLKAEKGVAKAIDTFINTLIKIRRGLDAYEKNSAEEKLNKAKEVAKTAVEALAGYKKRESRLTAEVKYGIKALRDAKYSETPLYNEDEDIWNLRRLIRYLLWHAAVVNKETRKILSRGPAHALLHNFALEEPEPPEQDGEPEKIEEPEEITEDGILLERFLKARRDKEGDQTIVARELALRSGSKRRGLVGGLVDDFILVDGDLAYFIPNFSSAIVAVRPGELRASGSVEIDGKKICLEGDEKIEIPDCGYITGAFTISGVGTVTIKTLAANQTARETKIDGKLVLLKGARFTTEFSVQTPAQQMSPSGPIPDPAYSYTGSGYFINSNTEVLGA